MSEANVNMLAWQLLSVWRVRVGRGGAGCHIGAWDLPNIAGYVGSKHIPVGTVGVCHRHHVARMHGEFVGRARCKVVQHRERCRRRYRGHGRCRRRYRGHWRCIAFNIGCRHQSTVPVPLRGNTAEDKSIVATSSVGGVHVDLLVFHNRQFRGVPGDKRV